MDAITNILHIGHRDEYELIASLLSDVHHRNYHLTDCPYTDAQLDLILSNSFDVIVLDYHWQENGSARDLLIAAIKQGCEVPIIVMTDEMEADVDREAIQLGASDYLIKGRIDSQLLERTIRYAIERKVAESKLAKLAHYDALTGVPNRILFRDRIEHAIQFASRDKYSFTLMYLDLDGFKQVNDNYGHDVGDELIRSCAARIVSSVRKSDSVARMGGDEFTVLLEQSASSADIAHIAEKIISSLEAPHKIHGFDIFIGCSIGIAVYPEAGNDVSSLLRNADKAMYQAKSIPASTYQFFTEAMNVEASQLLMLERELGRALDTHQIELFFKPIKNNLTGLTEGLMLEVDWYHPSKGWLSYREYENVAINQVAIGVSSWVMAQLELVVQEAKKHEATLPALILRVNHQVLNDRHFVDELKVLCNQANGVTKIELCLKEHELVEQLERSLPQLDSLGRFGCGVVLENLGAQLSSFDLIANAVVHRFIVDLALHDHSRVALISDLARASGKQLILANQDELKKTSMLSSHLVSLSAAKEPIQRLLDNLASNEVSPL
ncbi:two-component system response regulator [Aurantivibrio plasticivorans]